MGLHKHQSPTAGGTGGQSCQPVLSVPPRPGMSGRTVGVGRQPFRCCLEGLLRNQGRVGPLHLQRGSLSPPFWVPSEGPQIDRVGQDILHPPAVERIAPVGEHPQLPGPPGQGGHGLPCQKALIQGLHHPGFLLHRYQGVPLHSVAKGGRRLQLPPAGLFHHALAHLIGQVDGVVLRHGLQHGL